MSISIVAFCVSTDQMRNFLIKHVVDVDVMKFVVLAELHGKSRLPHRRRANQADPNRLQKIKM